MAKSHHGFVTLVSASAVRLWSVRDSEPFKATLGRQDRHKWKRDDAGEQSPAEAAVEGVSHMVGGRAASWLSTVLEPECHRVPWLEDDVISLCLVGSHEELRTMKGMERLEEHGRWDPLRPRAALNRW